MAIHTVRGRSTSLRKQGVRSQARRWPRRGPAWPFLCRDIDCSSVCQLRSHILSFLNCISLALLCLTLRCVAQRMPNHSRRQPGPRPSSLRCLHLQYLYSVSAMAVITSVELHTWLVLRTLVPHATQCSQRQEKVSDPLD